VHTVCDGQPTLLEQTEWLEQPESEGQVETARQAQTGSHVQTESHWQTLVHSVIATLTGATFGSESNRWIFPVALSQMAVTP